MATERRDWLHRGTYADSLRGFEERVCQLSGVAPEARRVLSLYYGCGGMDLGFEGGFIAYRRSVLPAWVDREINARWVRVRRCGFQTVFANDILPEAKATWCAYRARYDVDPGRYSLTSVVDLVKASRTGERVFPEGVDVVTGGFPCQDFSVAGKRRGFDSMRAHDGKARSAELPSEETRGKLYYWMKQVIDCVKPKVFVAENVKGLVSLGDAKAIIQRDFASADDGGYLVLPPKVLQAADYGVPESRERVIFIGVRRSALTPEAVRALEAEVVPEDFDPYPLPTHGFTRQGVGLLPPVTCRELFADLPEPEQAVDWSQQSYSKARYLGRQCQGQAEVNPDGVGPTIRSEHHGNIEFRRLSAEHGGHWVDELARGWVERRLTPRECALIQTFPPDHPFVLRRGEGAEYEVSPSGAYKVIGNAVPPVLAYAIARRLSQVWPLYFGV